MNMLKAPDEENNPARRFIDESAEPPTCPRTMIFRNPPQIKREAPHFRIMNSLIACFFLYGFRGSLFRRNIFFLVSSSRLSIIRSDSTPPNINPLMYAASYQKWAFR